MLDMECDRQQRAQRLILRAMTARAAQCCAVSLFAALSMGCTSTLTASHSDLGADAADQWSSTDITEAATADIVRPNDALDSPAVDAITDAPPEFDANIDARVWSDAVDGEGIRQDGSNDAPLPIGHRVLRIETSDFSDCALIDDGSVWCWGEESPRLQRRFVPRDGALAYIGPTRMITPGPVRDLIGVAGGYCVLDSVRQVWCWGEGFETRVFGTPRVPDLVPRLVPAARGGRLTHGGHFESFACAWEGLTPRCWGWVLPAYTFGGSSDAGLVESGPRAISPSIPVDIEVLSPISGVGFVGARTVRRWAEWRGTYAASATSWTLPFVPTQIAMNSPRGGGCAIDAEGAVACWGLRAGRSAPAIERVVGFPDALPYAVGITQRRGLGIFPVDEVGELEVLGRDGSVWWIRDFSFDTRTQTSRVLSPSPLPAGVADFKKSRGLFSDWLLLGDDGVVYSRTAHSGWTRFFP